jgi:hypothetical protein
VTTTVRAACSVVSPRGRPYRENPAITAFYEDLLTPFGVGFDEESLRTGRNVFHKDLVDNLIDADDDVGSRKPDLIIVTHALPDVHPFTTVASHLNMVVGGGTAKSFSISEQGLAAPFTALRVAASFQRSGRCEEALVVVLEQATLPESFPFVDSLVDSGVMLVLGSSAGLRVARVESTTDPRETTRRLAELAGEDPAGTLLVLGPWVEASGLDPAVACQRVDPGSYCTSVWLALADGWRGWHRDYDTVVLCDTEPRTGEGHFAVLRTDRSVG